MAKYILKKSDPKDYIGIALETLKKGPACQDTIAAAIKKSKIETKRTPESAASAAIHVLSLTGQIARVKEEKKVAPKKAKPAKAAKKPAAKKAKASAPKAGKRAAK